MSEEEEDLTMAELKAERAHRRLDEHADTHESFHSRISRNENWRLQMQGALKVIIGILGAGGLTWLLDNVGLF